MDAQLEANVLKHAIRQHLSEDLGVNRETVSAEMRAWVREMLEKQQAAGGIDKQVNHVLNNIESRLDRAIDARLDVALRSVNVKIAEEVKRQVAAELGKLLGAFITHASKVEVR